MCFAFIIIILNNPYNITSISVLLSYGGVIGIVFFLKHIRNILDKKKIPKYIKEIASVSIAVQIVIMPIMIYSYKTMSLTFLIANLLTSGLIGAIIIIRIYYSFIFANFAFRFN